MYNPVSTYNYDLCVQTYQFLPILLFLFHLLIIDFILVLDVFLFLLLGIVRCDCYCESCRFGHDDSRRKARLSAEL